MATYELDVSFDDEDEAVDQEHELDGVVYSLRFRWNRRDESWVLNVYTSDGTLLAAGRKMVLGFPLLRGEIDSRLPPGILMCVDLTGSGVEPGRTDIGIGKRVSLVYYDEDEVAA